jgi:hypothetical protein
MIRVMAIDTTNQKVRYIVAEGESITGEVTYQVKSGQIVEHVNGYKLALEEGLEEAYREGKVIFVMIEDNEISKIL